MRKKSRQQENKRTKYPSGANRNDQQRQHLATEAARIMAEEGVNDFLFAKRKACKRLNLPETTPLPTNHEIQNALTDYLQLFHKQTLKNDLSRLRLQAITAMQMLAAFEPRLIGSIVDDIVTPYSELQIHVTAESSEDVGWQLAEHDIPYHEIDHRFVFGGGRNEDIPGYQFLAESTVIKIFIFSEKVARESPLSAIDGKPMRHLSLQQLQQSWSQHGDSSPQPQS